MEPIRVLCVFARLDRGGAENMCMNLYRAMDKQKVQLDFIKHTSQKCDFDDEIVSLGGRIYNAPKYSVVNHIQYIKWWRTFFRKHTEYKLIHGHYFTLSHVYFKVAHEFGLHTIGHSHSEKPPIHSIKFWLKRHSIRWIEKESDFCLACSYAAGKYLFPHKKFYILNNAIDAKQFRWNKETANQIRSGFGIRNDYLVIGTCGRFFRQKNPFGILDIFYEVYKLNKKAVLLWVGDGEMRPQIENKIRKYDLDNCVILTGVRSDVNDIMQAMDVFILPSLWEGLAVVSIEAQAAGLPCYFSESVTKECCITDLCHYLPIDKPNKWAEEILSCQMIRKDMTAEIKNAGFDISVTSKWLEQFYLDNHKKLSNK